MEQLEMQSTVFGEVLAELLEKRGLPATPEYVAELGEDVGFDGRSLVERTVDTSVHAGYLDGLANALELTTEERVELAFAYAMERRADEEALRWARERAIAKKYGDL